MSAVSTACRHLAFLALGMTAMPASAQLVSATLPVTQNPNNLSDIVRATPVTNPDGTTIGSAGAAVSHSSYTLLSGATSTGAQAVAPDTYTLTFPTAFNGATISVAVTDPSGNVVTTAYTSAPTTPVAGYYGATSVTATASGGTPTGSLKLNGGPPASSGSGGGAVSLAAGEAHVGEVGGHVTVIGAGFTRPANTTAYAANQLFANSTTAGSVVAIPAAACRINQGHGAIVRASLSSSNPLAFNIQFRLHIFKTAPTSTVGDGGTWAGSVNLVAAIERGKIDITLDDKGSDGAKGFGAPNVGNVIGYDCAASSQNLYVLIETLGAYTPLSGETETVALEVSQD